MTTPTEENNPAQAPARDWRTEAAERDARLDALLSDLELSMESTFVPFSQSEKWETEKGKPPQETITHACVIYRVKNAAGGKRIVWSGQFHRGIGCLPAWMHTGRRTLDMDEAVKNAIETGKYPPARGMWPSKTVAAPALRDVMYSILQDASAIDSPTFEDWAGDLGYDTDSRKAEAIYRKCVGTGLKLRAALGEDGLARLREAFQDY